jgi:FMNH2-dependent dimethyl sulfone monooxygenase
MARDVLSNANTLKLGIFCTNCSGGLAVTRVPERWDPSWSNNVRVAQLCDESGFDFFLPVARWKGHRGKLDFEGTSWETITWATALLAATKAITVFGTVHVPLVHPVFAAKQMVTADAVGDGRFGLNIVCGWNPDEFAMFGVAQRDHDNGYEYGTEWWAIVRKLWTEDEPFDFNGRFFQLTNVIARPKPAQGRPVAINAGISPAGRDFCARNLDCMLTRLSDIDNDRAETVKLRALGRRYGNEISVFATAHVVLRPTQREADEYYHHYAVEMADEETLDFMLSARGVPSDAMSPEVLALRRRRLAGGCGSYPLVGTADAIAGELARISEAGFGGLALSFVNYLDELPAFAAEVLPRLERLELRVPARSSSPA